MVGDVGLLHPCGRLGGRARSVVDGDEGLRADRSSNLGKIGERGSPSPGVVVGRVGGPVIVVGKRAAGEAQRLRAIEVSRLIVLLVSKSESPDGGVDGKVSRIDEAHGLRRVYGYVTTLGADCALIEIVSTKNVDWVVPLRS